MKTFAIIITDRDEPYLLPTIKAARQAASLSTAPEIVVIQDGGSKKRHLGNWAGKRDSHHLPWKDFRGCQAARDHGIMQAKSDIVCVVDAHMDFDDGLWDDMLQLLADMDYKGIVGCGCAGLEPKEWKRDNTPRYFAYPIAWAEHRAFQFKWNYASRPVAKAFGAMGACYMMAKDWYVEQLLRPWQFGTGWGQDEEVLTVANFLAGGKVAVSEKSAYHWFRSQKELPYTTAGIGIYGQMVNAMRIWDMFPCSDSLYEKAMGTLAGDQLSVIRAQAIQKIRDDQQAQVEEYAAAFEALHGDLTMDDFMARCLTLDAYLAIDSSDPKPVASLPKFSLAADADEEEPEPKPRRPKTKSGGNAILDDDGSCAGKCRKCLSPTHAIHVYPNGNILVECTSCRRKAVVRKA